MDAEKILSIVARKSDFELEEMVANPSEWQEQYVKAAIAELSQRRGSEPEYITQESVSGWVERKSSYIHNKSKKIGFIVGLIILISIGALFGFLLAIPIAIAGGIAAMNLESRFLRYDD